MTLKENTNILSDKILEKYKNKKVPWGFNGLGYIVYKRTYSRLKEDTTYEEWYETVFRCINGAQKIGADYTKEEAERLYDYIFNLKCSFAGRMLWMLGTEHIDRWGGNALINCYFTTITKYEDFCFLFENLMLGGGVGFSVRREDIHELPRIKSDVNISHEKTKDANFIVPDSREGWVYLLKKVLKSYFITGKSFSYSTVLIRGYGETIKGLGGTASGPGILVDGIENIGKVIQKREGKKLRSIDVLDVCNIISSIVVSGNIRRSATIAIGDPDDYLFLRAKRWDLGNIPNWRSMSNNTIYADDFTHISNSTWEGYKGNGEPYGLFNIELSQKFGRIGEPAKDTCEGLNPCFVGDTKIETVYGQRKLKDLVGKKIPIYCYDGEKIAIDWMTNIKKTGIKKEVWKVTLDNDKVIIATPNHKFMLRDGNYKKLKDLKLLDSLMPFRRTKRNSKGYFNINLNNGTCKGEAHLVAEWKYNRKIKDNECVHHINKNKKDNSPENIEIIDFSKHSSNHIMGDNNPLRRFPEKNPVYLYPGKFKNENNGRWRHDITIEEVVDLWKKGFKKKKIAKLFNTSSKVIERRLNLAKINNHKIKKIEFFGYEDVYCGTVKKDKNFALEAGVIVHNCGEITLDSKGICCLTELFLNNIDSKEELIDCAKLLYKTQKAICALKFIHDETTEISNKYMRMGISCTGICQSLNKLDWLDNTYNEIKNFDKKWSKEKKYNESIKLTTVKPSGTLSLLSGSTPGVHPAFSKYYIRRVRMASNDKLIEICKNLGYKIEYLKKFDGSFNYNTSIVEFPCYSKDNTVLVKDMTAINQLELVKKMQKNWSDNSVSATVYYKKEELNDIKTWLKDNYKDNIKSISFLLHQEHGFEQSPYEEITKEQYDELIKNIKDIKNINVVDKNSITFHECDKGQCPIK